jgi:type IV secretory pathway VirB10-like protein
MPSKIRRLGAFSTVFRTARKMRILWPILAIFVLATSSGAQQAERVPPNEQGSGQALAQNPPLGESPVTLPPGTELALVLTHPIDSKVTHRGDSVFAQITDPVLVDHQVAIPAGTFVQGKVENLARQGNRAELRMQSISLAFPDGYVVNVTGPVEIKGGEGTAWINPSTGARTGALLAPLVGAGLGTAVGAAVHTTQTSSLGGVTITSSTPKGMAIGSMTGLAAGAVVSLALIARSHEFYVDEGAPLEMALPHRVTLARGPVADVKRAGAQP